MTRPQLEHVIRAAAAITGADRLVIIGSQAVLGQYPNAPPALTASIEADVFTFRSPEDADLIDGSIGEASPFHRTFGYYAHGVGEETAVLPSGWKDRLITLHTEATGGATALCLEAHDLAVSKLVAGREKDLAYVATMARHALVDSDTVHARLDATPLSEEVRARCVARLQHLAKSGT